MTLAAYERVMAVNATGAFLCMRAVLPLMKAARRGAVVATASIAGINAVPGQGAYAVSKHALIGLTRAAAVEAGPYGVRVNAVLPGPIDTAMMARIRRDSASTPMGGGTLLGRMGTPDEAAAVIAFLLSNDASFVTNSHSVASLRCILRAWPLPVQLARAGAGPSAGCRAARSGQGLRRRRPADRQEAVASGDWVMPATAGAVSGRSAVM